MKKSEIREKALAERKSWSQKKFELKNYFFKKLIGPSARPLMN